ncbi:MAG: dihydroorotase [Candidatus Thermoplasmatota archaeon]|nr:dihydroorotase [Candidatus Thermoplasmatota archaeon]
MDLVIRGKVLIQGKIEECCLGIKDGKICVIKKILSGDKVCSFSNKIILPTGIDVHVHFRDPGNIHKEDFKTGSMSAAYGGITCICDMPNTIPPVTSMELLEKKKKIVSKKSYIDFGLFAAISNENCSRLSELNKHCQGFKIFLGESTQAIKLNKDNLKFVLSSNEVINKPIFFHAEDDTCLQKYKKLSSDCIDHVASRPAICEKTAILNVLNAALDSQQRIHICHLSSLEGLNVLRNRPSNISVGSTPHHLFFDVENINTKSSFFKVNPPIRSAIDRESLWLALKTGDIDIVESDHAPHTIEEKEQNFDVAPSGMPGVETMYPMLLALVKKDKLDLQLATSIMCKRPAEIIGVPKGNFSVGMDADFIAVDFSKISKIKAKSLHYKCEWTPFEGKEALFPTDVFLRGEQIIKEKEIVVDMGFCKQISSTIQ